MDTIKNEIESRINALRQLLASTDYIAIRAAEGIPNKHYEEVRAQRQAWRNEITSLEEGVPLPEFDRDKKIAVFDDENSDWDIVNPQIDPVDFLEGFAAAFD